eukprot:gene8210-biopygen6113
MRVLSLHILICCDDADPPWRVSPPPLPKPNVPLSRVVALRRVQLCARGSSSLGMVHTAECEDGVERTGTRLPEDIVCEPIKRVVRSLDSGLK